MVGWISFPCCPHSIGSATFPSYSHQRLPISVAANNAMRRPVMTRHLIVNKHEVCKTNERNEKNCTARGTVNNTVEQCSHQKRAKKTKRRVSSQEDAQEEAQKHKKKKSTVSSTDCDSAEPTMVLTGNVPQVMDKNQSSQTRTAPTTRRERERGAKAFQKDQRESIFSSESLTQPPERRELPAKRANLWRRSLAFVLRVLQEKRDMFQNRWRRVGWALCGH